MDSWQTYYQQGGLVRVLIKESEDTLDQISTVAVGVLDAAAREHRFWNEYPLPVTDRFRAWLQGFSSRSYVLFELDQNDSSEYLSDIQQARYVRPATNSGYTDVLDNKVAFHLATTPYADILPTLYGTIESGSFVQHDATNDDFVSVVDVNGRIIVKPITGMHGTGVLRIEQANDQYQINGQDISKHELEQRIATLNDALVTEFVEQHEYANQIWPGSTNTIRMLTVRDPDQNKSFIARAVHRFGASSTGPTDNWTGGGIAAPVDIETGELNQAVTYSRESGIQRIKYHPETGTQIVGKTIPDWTEIKRAVLKVADVHRQASYVGWDVVLSKNGPLILEGNHAPGITTLQIGGGLLKNERVKRFFDQY